MCNKQNFVAFDFCVSQVLYFLHDLALVVGIKCNHWCRSLSVRWYSGDKGDKFKCNRNGAGKLVPRKSRSVIRFLWAKDISPIEIQRQLLWAYANAACQKMTQRVRNDTHDDRAGRPSMPRTFWSKHSVVRQTLVRLRHWKHTQETVVSA